MKIRPAVQSLGRQSYGANAGIVDDTYLDCALGTNVHGTSPKVIDFVAHYDWSTVYQYPDNSYNYLKKALCRFWADYANLDVSNIKVCNGSSFILSNLNKILIDPGDKVLGVVPQFTEYKFEVEVFGGIYEAVPLMPEERFKFNFDRFIKSITPGCKIVYLNNPNNPTGEFINLDQIEEVVKVTARRDIIIIIDEAYGDYIEEKHSAINLMGKYPNLIITRTFSKCYGLAQARVGYAVLSKELGHFYDEIDLPFSVSTIGAKLAREALMDYKFVTTSRKRIKTEKIKVITELKKRGFSISETNDTCPIFVAGSSNDINGKLDDYFLSKKIHVLLGTDFVNLTDQYARISTPVSGSDFINRLSSQNSPDRKRCSAL